VGVVKFELFTCSVSLPNCLQLPLKLVSSMIPCSIYQVFSIRTALLAYAGNVTSLSLVPSSYMYTSCGMISLAASSWG
jgi:hypothetical protein